VTWGIALLAKTKEFFAAGLASIVSGIVDLAVLIALVESGMSVPVAAFVAALCGAVAHFALSKYFAFRDGSPLAFGQALRFAIVAVGAALFVALAMQLFAVRLQLPYVLAKVPSSVLVFVAWTYPAQRYFVFNRRPSLAVPSTASLA
jgi:putative flippase GtrA